MGNRMQTTDSKCNSEAIKFREQGNKYYQQRKFCDSLILYNMSIAHADSKKIICLAYANRSAAYFEIKRYEECLKNIEWARRNSYPKDKMYKLNERERKCLEMMKKGSSNVETAPWDIFKLSYPANKKIPWIADCLEMRVTEKYGRGIYAKRNLKPGDIISIDKPIFQIAINCSSFKHCARCFRVADLNLIPCKRTSKLMYCSEKCRDLFDSAMVDIKTILNIDVNILSRMIEMCGGKQQLLDLLIDKREKIDAFAYSIFDFDWSDPTDPKYKENLVTCFFSLYNNINPLVLWMMDCCSKNYVPEKVAKMICGIHSKNVHEHFYFECEHPDGLYISLFGGLINHSCVNNVEFVSVDNKAVTIVSKPIKAGEQLFSCYFKKHSDERSTNKIQEMMFHKIQCDCLECTNESYNYLEPKGINSIALGVNRDTVALAKRYLKEGQYYLNQNSKSRQELVDYEARNSQVYVALANFCTFPCQ